MNMARFIFQLEAVLRHRQRIERDRQGDLAVAQKEMVRLEADLRAIDHEVKQATADVRDNRLTGRLDLNYLAAHRRYMLGMQRKVMALAQKMAAQQKLVEDARRALADASKQKKVMEKLEERQFQRWLAALALREAGELDELTTQLSFRSLAEQREETA